jgi:hypothetical protein
MSKPRSTIGEIAIMAFCPGLSEYATMMRAEEDRLTEENFRKAWMKTPPATIGPFGLEWLSVYLTARSEEPPAHIDTPPKQKHQLPPRNTRPKGRR